MFEPAMVALTDGYCWFPGDVPRKKVAHCRELPMRGDWRSRRNVRAARTDVNIYLARPSLWAGGSLTWAESTLGDEERRRLSLLPSGARRQSFVVAHALLRWALSQHAPLAPHAWRFRREAEAKPELDNGDTVRGLHFSLSHSREFVTCALSQNASVGLDVEASPGPAPLSVARRFFDPKEADALSALPEPVRSERFLVYWTLKESYVKARGLGLRRGLNRCAFHLGGGRHIRAELRDQADDVEDDWSFESWALERGHRLSVAVNCSRLQSRVSELSPRSC